MICQNCGNQLSNSGKFCSVCGNAAAAYVPPEGFELDPESLRYYRSEVGADGMRWVTWFDQNTGEYEQVSYPPEQAGPEQTQEYAPPEGFEFDQSRQCYCRPVSDADGTQWMLLFDQSTGDCEEELIAPPPELTQPPARPQAGIPEGFMLDLNSGVYYRAMPGKDPATGANGQWYTWFYPETGEYLQQFYPETGI